MHSGGRSRRAARATRALPSAITGVAPSSPIARVPPGTARDQGFVPKKRTRLPWRSIAPMPGPPAPTVTIPISPAPAARSVYSPSRPMWAECRTATRATPWRGARAIAHSIACIVEKWPKPRPASTRATTSLSRSIAGRAAGISSPRSAWPTYMVRRITPWESWPERFERTRCRLTSAATSAPAPIFRTTPRTKVSSGPAGQLTPSEVSAIAFFPPDHYPGVGPRARKETPVTTDPTLRAKNAREGLRLKALVARLSDADLGRPVGHGWTVADTLVHLAFWDLRAVTLIDRCEKECVKASPADG